MKIDANSVITICYALAYVFEAFINYIYFSDIFEKRYNKTITIFSMVGISLLGDVFNILFNTNMFINTAVYLTLVYISCMVFFKTKWTTGLFYSALSTAIMDTTEMIGFLIVPDAAGVLGIGVDIKMKAYNVLIMSIISKVLYLIVAKLFSLLIARKRKTESQNLKRNIVFLCVPVFVTLLLISSFIPYAHENILSNYRLLYLAMSIVGTAFCCFIFVYNEHINEQEKELSLLRDEKQKNEINTTFYELLEKKNEDERVLVHDIKHHFAAINSMENIDDIKKYLSKIQNDFDEYQFIGKTKNKMFDLILSKYSHLFEKNNIEFNVEVRAANLAFIDDNDLVSLLSNLLDNALEASIGSKNAFVSLETKVNNTITVLSVINSSSHSPQSDGSKLLSTKSEKAFHGFGTKSIERIAKKYKGECEWYFDKGKFEFHYNILFN